MAAPPPSEQDGRGRAVAITVVQSVAILALLVAAYVLAPLDREPDLPTGVRFGLVLLGLIVLLLFQIRGVLRAQRPRLRAIRTVVVGLPLLVVAFAAGYVTLAARQPDAFTEPLNKIDGIYFAVTVFATVGFGDITARSDLARVLVTTQMIVGLVALGLVVKVLQAAVRAAERRDPGARDRKP